jgi:ABC-type nitrate/sulfonate/bicarbonate transport system substrate-binding protein
MSAAHPRRPFGGLLVVALVAALACTSGARSAPAAPPAPVASAPTASPAAASAAAPTPAKLETVRVAQTVSIGYAPIYLADALGYYQELGIEQSLDDFPASADVVPALARGEVDVNLGAVAVGTFNAYTRGLDLKIVAPVGILPLQDSSLPLLARKDLLDSGAVATVADLRGQKVAVNTPGAVVEYLLTTALATAGLALPDVEEISLPFPDHGSALATGAIAASITAEPFATRAVTQGVAAKLGPEIAPGRMVTVVMYSGQFIRERNDAARRWMVATMRGVRALQGPALGVSYPEKLFTPENLAIFERYTKVSAQVIRDQVSYTWDPDLEIQRDFILDQERVHIRNGRLPLAEPIPPENLIDDSFVRHAQEVLGRARP